jgi:hypothetical protein
MRPWRFDPGRIGWRLAAVLWEYPDGDWTDHTFADLGGARVTSVDSATQQARVLATRAWVALRDYLIECPDPITDADVASRG